MPTIQADISGLADLASTYAVAAPELVRAAKALVTTNTTIVQKQDSLKGFFAGTAGFANTTADFLDGTGDRIIQAGRVSRPSLALFAKYSPQYPCMATALTNWVKNIDGAWKNDTFHITLEINRSGRATGRARSLPGARSAAPTATACPTATAASQPAPGHHLRRRHEPQGAARPAAPCRRPSRPAAASRSPTPARGWPAPPRSRRSSPPCSPGTAPGPSAITTLLAGPMLRGSVVNQR